MRSFSSLEQHFIDYCLAKRDDPPGGHQAEVYRRLIQNGLYESLRVIFPLARRFVGEEKFRCLVKDFAKKGNLHTPYLGKLGGEFLSYLQEKESDEDLGQLVDLLAFEWIDFEVDRMANCNPPYSIQGDVLKDLLVMNQESRLYAFSYPVFSSPSHFGKKMDQEKAFVFFYRHPQTLRVEMVQLSPLFCAVVEILLKGFFTGEEVLLTLGEKFSIKDKKDLLEKGCAFLHDLREKGALLGFQKEDR